MLNASMHATSQIEINLTRLDGNLAALRRLVGPSVMVCGVVKADAYGLGAVPIAARLASRGIDMLAVYSPQQAADLVRAGIEASLLVMMPVRELKRDEALDDAARKGRLHLTVHDLAQMEELDRCAETLESRLAVHCHLDTGMSRGGLNREQFDQAIKQIKQSKALRLAGAYTHFACAEDDVRFTGEQMDLLESALHELRQELPNDLIVHVANTFAAHRHRRYHQVMIRVGLCLYGYGPSLIQGPALSTAAPLVQPIVRWQSRLVHVGQYPHGASVGYNRTHTTTRPSLLGVIPVGYADGYPLALSNRGIVELIGPDDSLIPAPAVGKVNMDQIVVDLTDVPAPLARVGTEVLLISDDPDSPCCVEQLAKLANSSCYETLCRLSPHVPRVYK